MVTFQNRKRTFAEIALVASWLGTATTALGAAPPLRLYNSGVDDTGALLSADSADPHYRITLSADPRVVVPPPAPPALVAIPNSSWLATSITSKWIAPQADQTDTSDADGSHASLSGNYEYSTTFTLTCAQLATAAIIGEWATDNSGVSIFLNGSQVGSFTTPGGPASAMGVFDWNPFSFGPAPLTPAPFVVGKNTLTFRVFNNPTSFGDNYTATGLQVRFSSAPALDLYNSGVDDTRALLSAGSSDPHYRITLSADPRVVAPPPAPPARVAVPNSGWHATSTTSKWIAPQADQTDASDADGSHASFFGNYEYSTTFDLTCAQLPIAVIIGQWATDNNGVSIFLNGSQVGSFTTPGGPANATGVFDWNTFSFGFGTTTPAPFVVGKNVLTFRVFNNPTSFGDNYTATGLQVRFVAVTSVPALSPWAQLTLLGALIAIGLGFITLRRNPGNPSAG